jgi:serine/threonine protein kinase
VSKWTMAGEDMSLTDSSVVVGSPLYMAPEQMRAARNAEPRSDIWALGVILYELLAGKVPFDGATVTELCLKVVTDPPTPIADLRAEIPAPLAAIVARCLEKDPEKRFENVALLATALEPFASTAGASRGWRSMVETGDSLDIGELPTTPQLSDVATDSSRASLLKSEKRPILDPPPSSRGPKRKAFTKGLAAGAALTAIGAIAGAIFWATATHSNAATPNATSSAPNANANATTTSTATADPPASAMIPTITTAPTPSSISPALSAFPSRSVSGNAHFHATAPAGSAGKTGPAAIGSANAFTPPNGAPILH